MVEWKAKTVFHAYLDEIWDSCEGVVLIKEARSAINTNLDRQMLSHDGAARLLVTSALSQVVKIQEAHIVRAMFMSAHAGFEQYLRSLFEAAAVSITNAKLKGSELDGNGMNRLAVLESLRGWQINLAGDAFIRYFEPLAHINVDYSRVAKAISHCEDETNFFTLEGKVFGFRVGNIDQATVENLFKRFKCTLLWDDLTSDNSFQKLMEQTNKKDTDKELTRFMSEALKIRNRIAHTQGEITMTKDELLKHISFLRYVSQYLFEKLSTHVSKFVVRPGTVAKGNK